MSIRHRLRAETAAYVGGDDAHLVNLDAQPFGDFSLRAHHPLTWFPDRHMFILPGGDAGVRLHRHVVFARRRVPPFDFYFRLRHRLMGIAEIDVGAAALFTRGARIVRVNQRRLRLILHFHQSGSPGGLLEGLRHYKADILAVMDNLIVLNRRIGGLCRAAVGNGGRLIDFQAVEVGVNRQHARRLTRLFGIHAGNASAGNGGLDHHAVRRVFRLMLNRIARFASHLNDAVAALALFTQRLITLFCRIHC